MKTKQKGRKDSPKEKAPAAKKAKAPRKKGKKFQFEDGVRAALIAAAVICAAVLGVGGFFMVRSILHGDVDSLPAASSVNGKPEAGTVSGIPENSMTEPLAETAPEIADATPEEIPGLEQAIHDLEAAGLETVPPVTSPAAAEAVPPPTTPPVPLAKGILIIVIDDAGNNLRDMEPFLQFPGPLTIAVLPGLPNSVEAARRVRAAAGKELFLHQPMEPLNGQDPGPGAIKTGMSAAQVKEIIVKNLNEIGPVAGFNNHEGSRATSDPAIMRAVLEISRDSALYFLDSRTTADTVAPQIAAELGIRIAGRHIFLDNEQDRESILAALEAGCKRAEENGYAILIGHAWSPRLAALLTEMYPPIIKRGLVFGTIGTLLSRGK